MHFLEVNLQTTNLMTQQDFYTNTLGLTLLTANETTFTVLIGESCLTFTQTDDDQPLYHIAFNIPENQLAISKTWLAQRVPLLPIYGDDEIFFEDWNAHACYFEDPDKNILELIARHNLTNLSQQPFSVASLLNISEVALPVKSVQTTCQTLSQNLNIDVWRGDITAFAAMGDENGLFIIVPEGRGWLPVGTPATLYPLSVRIAGQTNQTLHLPDSPYQIFMEPL